MLKHAVIKNGPSLEQEEQFAGVSTEVQLAVVVDNGITAVPPTCISPSPILRSPPEV